MSPRLVLEFLGLPQVHLDDHPVATDRRKAIALLAYLAVNDGDHSPQRYSREALSALFWPDYEQAKAFSNLQRTIWEVHQALGEGWLSADRESVQLLGMADTIREKIGDPRPLLEQVDVDKIIAACLIRIGEAAFSEAYDEGAEMTLEEAVASAMKIRSASLIGARRVNRDSI